MRIKTLSLSLFAAAMIGGLPGRGSCCIVTPNRPCPRPPSIASADAAGAARLAVSRAPENLARVGETPVEFHLLLTAVGYASEGVAATGAAWTRETLIAALEAKRSYWEDVRDALEYRPRTIAGLQNPSPVSIGPKNFAGEIAVAGAIIEDISTDIDYLRALGGEHGPSGDAATSFFERKEMLFSRLPGILDSAEAEAEQARKERAERFKLAVPKVSDIHFDR